MLLYEDPVRDSNCKQYSLLCDLTEPGNGLDFYEYYFVVIAAKVSLLAVYLAHH